MRGSSARERSRQARSVQYPGLAVALEQVLVVLQAVFEGPCTRITRAKIIAKALHRLRVDALRLFRLAGLPQSGDQRPVSGVVVGVVLAKLAGKNGISGSNGLSRIAVLSGSTASPGRPPKARVKP